MSVVPPPRRPIVLKASRDTLVLLAAASAVTLAIGSSVRSHSAAPQDPRAQQVVAGEWAGQLAELSPDQTTAPTPVEPLTSDALTVPKAAMALPLAPRPALPAKPRLCEGAICAPPAKTPAGILATAVPVRRPATAVSPPPIREASLAERLNPMNHLPDMVTRPFASASNTIAGWVKRF